MDEADSANPEQLHEGDRPEFPCLGIRPTGGL